MPIYFAYFLLGIEAGRWKGYASRPMFLFLYAFGHFTLYRARRYRLTRTVWRAIRFRMDGSGFGYMWRACLWGLLVCLTLGLALPWREAALERYKMRHTYYGDLQGKFVGTGWEFFKRGWWIYLLAWWIPAIATFELWLAAFLLQYEGGVELDPAAERSAAFVGIFELVCIPPMLVFLYATFKATEWRWRASGLRFGELRVTSDLRLSAFFGNYWATIGWSFLAFTLFAALIIGVVCDVEKIFGDGSFLTIINSTARGGPAGMALLGGYLAAYFATLLATGAVTRIFLMRGVWRKVAASITITGLAATESVCARGAAVNALGEDFADTLDVAGF